ncbi:ATP-binding protein [Actinophytocola sp.]|uniref:ATP-binding protein n=1 Tax=Actinophytocola sp. TaxID=1872138 RepID=UPI002D49E113|nr:AAA family ATPase [Actinophytocola sp.]HYQ68783.1 AAA family ATPase [Actinophytocola sp.]
MAVAGARAGELVGRGQELARVDVVLSEVAGGAFRAMAIRGEPGVGKTALLTALAERAEHRGLTVNRGRATEFERGLPFAIFADAFERLAAIHHASAELDILTAVTGGGTAELDRYRLFRGVRRLLEWRAGESGTVLVLDDLHWADQASLELIEFLLRRPPRAAVLVALAYRTAQPPPGLADALARLDPAATQLVLDPLGPADVAALYPEEPARRRALLHRATRGNPLYLRALADTDEQTLTVLAEQAVDDRAVPEQVLLDVLGAELATLDPVSGLVAQAAAVAGDPADRDLVTVVAELSDEAAATAFDTLSGAGVMAPEGPRLRFRHPLVRAAAYWLAPPAWRTGAHRRAAGYLRDRRGPVLALAHHTERSARPGDEVAVATLVDAATATRHTAPAMAARLARRALQLVPDRAEFADRRLELLMLLARALGFSGELAESRLLLHEVIQADGPQRAEAVTFCAVVYRLLGKLDEATALLTSELDRLPPRGERVAQALLELSGVDLLRHDAADVCRHAGRALEAVAGTGNTGLAASAHAVLALGLLQRAETAPAGTHIARAGWLVDAAPDAALLPELGTVAPLVWVELHLRHHDRAERHIRRALALARSNGLAHTLPYLLIVDTFLRTRLGQLPEALAAADEARECATIMRATEAAAMADIVRLRPTLWRHGPRAALALAAEVAAAGRPGGGWWSDLARISLAEVHLGAGDEERCLAELAGEHVEDATAASYRWALRAVASAALRHPDEGRHAAGEALRHARRSGLAHHLGAAHHAHAVVLDAEDDLGAATEHASAAVRGFAEAGSPVEEGIARRLLAVLHARGGRRAAARGELGRAKALFSATSADWLAGEVARDERRFAGRAPRPRRSTENGLATLTAREREVVDLVAAGLTNREVAERLYLSHKTVETHLSRAFAKLHVRSRVDLTRRVAESD